MPSKPPSRPNPLALTPPNGAAGLEIRPDVDPDHAELQRLGHPDGAGQVARVDVGRQPVLGVVGLPDRLLLGLEGGDRRDRAEDLLHVDLGVDRHVEQHGRRVEVARPVGRLRRRSRRVAPSWIASVTSWLTLSTAFSSISGPTSTPSSWPRPRVRAPIRSPSFSANSCATERCTRNRLAAVHASPMLRIFAIIAPSTAASTSASSKTRNGALPPSSMLSRWSWSADWRTSTLPTPVEPVKLTLRSRSSAWRVSLNSPVSAGGHDVEHAVGQPGLGEHAGQRQHRQRRLAGGLDHHRAAGGDRRARSCGCPSRAGSSTG